MKFANFEFPEFGLDFDFSKELNHVFVEAYRLWYAGQPLNSLRLLNALARHAKRARPFLLRGLARLEETKIVLPVLEQGKHLEALGDLEGAFTCFRQVEMFRGAGEEEATRSIQQLQRAFREVSGAVPNTMVGIEYAREVTLSELPLTADLFRTGQNTPALRLYNLVHEKAQSEGLIVVDPADVREMLEPLEKRVFDEGKFLVDIGEMADSLSPFEQVEKFGGRHAGAASQLLSSVSDALTRDAESSYPTGLVLRRRGGTSKPLPHEARVEQDPESKGIASSEPKARYKAQVLRRTPHMELNPPNGLKPGTEFLVTIYADTQPLRTGEQATGIEIVAPADIKRFALEIFLSISSHFSANNLEGSMVIYRNASESTRSDFQIRVKADAQAGVGTITAYFSYKGRPSGHVTRQVQIGAGETQPGHEECFRGNSQSGSVQLLVHHERPDLTVDIWEHEDRDGRKFFCRVLSPLLPQFDSAPKAWNLKDKAPAIVDAYMKQFTSKVPDTTSTIADLRGAGIDLYKAAPPNFQEIFWKLVDSAGKNFRTILVVTQEPTVPWELMLPFQGTRNGGNYRERDLPLGVEFTVGRWIREGPPGSDEEYDLSAHVAPPQKIGLCNSYGIAPEASGLKPLAHALPEVEMVIHKVPGKRINPASFKQIDTDLAAEGRSLMHFACHGAAGTSVAQVIHLDAYEKLNSVGVKQMVGFKAAFPAKRPLVFLNACEVGRGVPALVGVGGFAAAFIELGASGVIAPLWSVKDEIAHHIACTFYERITMNPAVAFAAVFQELRKQAYVSGEDSFAAYCFYGDPLAKA